MNCHRVITNANFIVHSLPNADTDAVENSIRRLSAIQAILFSLDHHFFTREHALETFRQIFMYLEACHLLSMENLIHRTCLYLVFCKRVQDALDRARDAWNHHQLRTEGNRTPIAIYELSREEAILRGHWTGDGDPYGDPPEVAHHPNYAVDGEATDPCSQGTGEPLDRMEQPTGIDAERAAGVAINDDAELDFVRHILTEHGLDWDRDDGNWGINVYCQAMEIMIAYFSS
ncbi:hypothetical protein HDZ31DRAFT_85824 [Schizophyllum fasciatum]